MVTLCFQIDYLFIFITTLFPIVTLDYSIAAEGYYKSLESILLLEKSTIKKKAIAKKNQTFEVLTKTKKVKTMIISPHN